MNRCVLLVSLTLALPSGRSAQGQDVEVYRKHALTHEGDAARGRDLFDTEKLLCGHCHSIDGSASKAGPDLATAGDAFGRRDLVESVLKPSATIAPGYGTVIVETKAGVIHLGVLKQSTEKELQLMGVDGLPVSVPVAGIKERSGTAISLMPDGLHAALSQEEFTDLIEYLTTLKEPESTQADDRGAPREIPLLAKPVAVRPYFAEPFVLPRGKAETGLSSFRPVPRHAGNFLVLHQKGVIWRIEKTADTEKREVFADLEFEVFSERGPNGLLDVCFHPKFAENRNYYLFYQIYEDGVVVSKIVEKQFNESFTGDSGQPAREIIRIASVAEDHSGGCLDFGADGFLYVVMGDTGPHNDPNGHAQNLELLLGKMLRIDVNHEEAGKPYAIPKDNPFVGQPGVSPEIWAYGLRNPWRFCFDRPTGDLWLADVGQDRMEEVALIRRGENHGWNVYEGFEPFSNQYRQEGRTFVRPVFAYRHKYGNSITGGHVYRGDKDSSFNGVYVCGDFNSKRLFGITQKNGALEKARQIGEFPQRLVSFGEDAAGNIYGVGYEGMVYLIDFTNARFE